jgi:hypothetical protein
MAATQLIVATYYLTPAQVLRRVQRAFRGWPDLAISIYSTNPMHGKGTTEAFTAVPNDFNDFSSYMRACDDFVLGVGDVSASCYVFLNDTLFTRHPWRVLLRLLQRMQSTITASELPILCGQAGSYRMLMQTSPFAVGLNNYISTFLFATNRPGVRLLAQLFNSADCRLMLGAVREPDPRGPIPGKLRGLLQLQLGSHANLYSWRGDKSGDAVPRKASCIVLEHYVSAMFFEHGFLYPLNGSVLLELLVWFADRLS